MDAHPLDAEAACGGSVSLSAVSPTCFVKQSGKSVGNTRLTAPLGVGSSANKESEEKLKTSHLVPYLKASAFVHP